MGLLRSFVVDDDDDDAGRYVNTVIIVVHEGKESERDYIRATDIFFFCNRRNLCKTGSVNPFAASRPSNTNARAALYVR